ncbi:MAG: hybrid sensor histidine kinase/response regulator [Rhodospirillaceae bacterium]|nr:hybrid sensor histidine kinase/response regulator [Rhodospirillaceae bacterium]
MDDLIAEFIAETTESLNVLDSELVKFERDPNEGETLKLIFRVMHTIKGTCGFLGLSRLEKVAHAGEDVLVKYRDKELTPTPQSVTIILECLDRIRGIITDIASTGSEPAGDDSQLIAKLKAAAAGKLEGAAAPAAAAPAAAKPAPTTGPVTSDEGFPVAADLLAEIEAAMAAKNKAEGKAEPEPAPAPAATPPVPVKAAPPAAATAATAPPTAKLEPKAADPAKAGGEAKAAAQSIRVNVDVLENMMNLVSEMVLTRNQLLQMVRGRADSEFKEPLQRLSRVTTDLQEGVMKTRMQPVGNAWQKLPRIIRDLSTASGKKIDLQMVGAETELDRQVLEFIADPLLHMVRNSADHGLEGPEERLAAGKPEVGVVRLMAYHQGGHIIMEITDDGRGLNTARIRQKIVEKGLASQGEVDNMPDHEVHQYIMRAGFSTAEKITNVSGRGVGMDVVRANIEKIGGTVDFRSVQGQGTAFTIKIPLTLAIVAALIVEAGDERFAIPQISVNELVSTGRGSDHKVEMVKGAPVLRLRGRLLPLVNLRQLLRLDGAGEPGADRDGFVVVTQAGNKVFGIVVDGIYDTEEIVVKPVAPILKSIPFYSGNTILGDGTVIMILDPNGVADQVVQTAAQIAADEAADKFGLRDETTSLLLFTVGDGSLKAVPLGLVSRLESFPIADLQRTEDGAALAQYRGRLIPVIAMGAAFPWKTGGGQPALVFTDQQRTMALAVDEIVDIVNENLKVEVKSTRVGIMGTAIIAGKTVDLIDTSYFMKQAYGAWFSNDPEEAQSRLRRQRRLLLVDDSAFFRNLLAPYLNVEGFEVVTAENPKRALELRDAGLMVDAIVTDIEMPEMDGFGFAEALKGDPRWGNVPMIAITSRTEEKYRNRGMSLGFKDYIGKDQHKELIRALNECLVEGVES